MGGISCSERQRAAKQRVLAAISFLLQGEEVQRPPTGRIIDQKRGPPLGTDHSPVNSNPNRA